ncbi:MAG: response regulator [Kangiellaceae bacterium]|nr:response regulator [Kangiellaceae bacterium]MCW9000665.1 response regulator [Kangiellaceae bacterium]MCW9018312.1 response regulator [Kangiellaceae bacterium]
MTASLDKPANSILLVDDEKNILLSLRRLFRPVGYQVLTATSGAEGLQLIEDNPVDLIISDMRMPEMTGAEFLERVANQWPDIVRILLTGFSDVDSTIDAINKGKIYKYVTKPWDDTELKMTVSQALEMAKIRKERDSLQKLTQAQNVELKDLNSNLEQKVEARTADLNKAMGDLKSSYMASVKTFSSLIEMRKGLGAGESRKVAELARRLAIACGSGNSMAQSVMVAGLLHNIGKLSLPDNLICKPYLTLTEAEKKEVHKHPLIAESVLMGLEPLSETAKIIRSHHELYNGRGYPDHLAKGDIPVGACVLCVANEFEELKSGRLYKDRYSEEQAIEMIKKNSGIRYHPKVVEAFLKLFGAEEKKSTYTPERILKVMALRPGMVLSKDIVTQSQMLLLTKGRVLNEQLIEKLENYEVSLGDKLDVHVKINVAK